MSHNPSDMSLLSGADETEMLVSSEWMLWKSRDFQRALVSLLFRISHTSYMKVIPNNEHL